LPLIDDRGRLFGRLNLIDAVVGVVVLLLVPLAYGAFLLFRVPKPEIISVAPAQVAERQAASVLITGENLRPFLVAKIGAIATDLFVQSPKRAEIKVPPNLAAGTYDITLLDQGQVLAIKPGALAVGTLGVRLDVQAVGAFVGLSKEDAGSIGITSTFQAPSATAPIAEVLALQAPEPGTSRVKIGTNVFATGTLSDLRVPAIIRLHCIVLNGECRVGDTVAAQDATVMLPSAAAGQIRFLIDQLFPSGMRAEFPALASVRVRFFAGPNILNVIKAGDVDVGGVVTDTGRAVLTELGTDRQTVTSQVEMDPFLRIKIMVPQPLQAFTATVRVPAVFTPSGWSYNDRPLKVGGSFTFETASGAMSGLVLDMNLGREKSRATQ
jgi:hypothetical protein